MQSIEKQEMAKEKEKAYELYERLNTRDGEPEMHCLARQRDKGGQNVQHVKNGKGCK